MTLPQSPSLTFEEALAAAMAMQSAVAAADTLAATVADLSSGVIAAREAAAAYAQALILALWADLDPYDGAAVQAFTERAAAHMVTAQTVTARSAAAAQAEILRRMGVPVPGVPSNPVDIRAPGVDVIDGVLVLRRPDRVRVDYDTRANATIRAEDFTTVGMFNRPARTLRALVAEGAPREVADEAARARIATLVEDNAMLAQRFAEAEILQNAVNLDLDVEIIGYRRVIHPELSRTGVCGLCIAAADQRYKVGTLLPLHDRCKCTSAAITEDHDPAEDVNTADLAQLYRLAGSTAGADLKRIRFQENEHGELGPTLVPKKKAKRGNARRRRKPQTSTSSNKPPTKPPTGGQSVSGADEPQYPPVGGDGGDVPFTPADPPPVTDDVLDHIMEGHGFGAGQGKTEFPEEWDRQVVREAIGRLLSDPSLIDEIERRGSTLYFRGAIDGLRIEARARGRKGPPKLWTAYPLKD